MCGNSSSLTIERETILELLTAFIPSLQAIQVTRYVLTFTAAASFKVNPDLIKRRFL